MFEFLNPYLFRPRLERFVLLIGDSGAILARITGGSVVSQHISSGTAEENIAEISRLLIQAPSVPVVVLFDVLAQAYRRDQIPVVNFLDRAKIVARRLETLFPGTEFRGGLRLGASPGGARSVEYLFGSVTQTLEINSWRKFLDLAANPLDGARLLPVESTSLLERLIAHVSKETGQVSQWHMLMSQHRTGGFRQIVVRKGQLVMTRMTPGAQDLSAPQEIASLLQREIAATIDYITRLGFDRAEGLDAVFIGREDICAAMRGAQLPVRRLSALNPAQAEAIAKLSGTLDSSGHYSDLLHATWGGGAWLSRMPVLPEEKRQKRLIEVGQRWGARLAIAASLAGLIYGAALSVEIKYLQEELSSVEALNAKAQQSYDAQITNLDSGPVAAEWMRNVIDVHYQLDLMHLDVSSSLTTLDGALGEGQKLRSITLQSLAPGEAISQRIATVETPVAAGQAEKTAADSSIVIVIDLDRFTDVELAVSEVESLAERLRLASPDMQVTIRRQPLQILPGDTLSMTSNSGGLSFPMGSRIAEIEMGRKPK